MSPVACTRCHAAFDVSHLEPGTTFICGTCGTELRVPDDPHPVPRAHRPSHVPAARRKSKVPLIALCAGAALAVLGVGVVVLPGGGGDEESESAPVQVGRKLSESDRIRELELGIFAAYEARDTARLREIHLEATDMSARGTARKAAEYAIAADPELDWAHQTLGHLEFDGGGLPSDEEVRHPTPDWEFLKVAARERWMDRERCVEVEAAKRRFLTHRRKLASNPHYRRTCEFRRELERHDVLSGTEYLTVEKRPYLVFAAKAGDERKTETRRKLVEARAALLLHLHDTFVAKYGKSVALPKLASDVYEEDQILGAWLFSDRKRFKRYHESIRAKGAGTATRYNPDDRWLALSWGAGGVGENRGNMAEELALIQEGTCQLLHHFTKRVLEAAGGGSVSWDDPRLETRSLWFREGTARYFSSASKRSGSWRHFLVNSGRLRRWKGLRERGCREWELEDLLAVTRTEDLGRTGGAEAWMPGLFLDQAWAFVHFLNEFDGGKYRAKLSAYMKGEFGGRSGIRAFKEAFGLTVIAGSELERDFIGYSQRLLDGV